MIGPAKTAGGAAPWDLIGLLAALIGVAIVMFTNVSVLSGMNQVVFGAILAAAGAVVVLVGRRSVGIRITCVVLAVVAVVGAVYDQQQVDQRRQELQNIFNSP